MKIVTTSTGYLTIFLRSNYILCMCFINSLNIAYGLLFYLNFYSINAICGHCYVMSRHFFALSAARMFLADGRVFHMTVL